MKRLVVMAALALLSLVVETMIQPSRLRDDALKTKHGQFTSFYGR